jgi:predicted nucleic acid-binding protein
VLVIDASIAIALVFPDEESPQDLTGADLIGSLSPTLWLHEVLSALRSAERRGRIEPDDAQAAAIALASLPIELAHPAFEEVLEVSRATEVGVYDASYLTLALAYQVPLATRDQRLTLAATSIGVATTC